MCNFLLHFWNIPTPKVANVTIDKSLLENGEFSHSHKPHYYDLPTFGSKNVANTTEMNKFLRNNDKHDINKFKNSKDLLKIGLFDIWVENTDRKPTNNNILFQHNKKTITIFALDHAFTFDSLSYENLNADYISNTWNENILATSFSKKLYSIIKDVNNWINEIREYFYFCIRECEQNFDAIVQYIPKGLGFSNELKELLKSFLFNDKRNKLVFEDFISRFET